MIEMPLQTIDEAVLLELIAEKRPEDRRLEYKRDFWDGGSDGTKEMLSDITAFANTDGGDFVIGMDEDRSPDNRGVASELIGLSKAGLEKQLDRLRNQLKDCVDPRLPPYDVQKVELTNGNIALVLRVPASITAPHRVSASTSSSRFVARDSRGKYDMTTEQIRRAFLASDDAPKQIRALHDAAVIASSGMRMPAKITDGPRVIVTIAPLSIARERREARFTTGNAVLPPHVGGNVRLLVSLDGVIAHLPVDPEKRSTDGWAVNHFRGYVDFAWSIGTHDSHHGPIIWSDDITNELPGHVRSAVTHLQDRGIGGPWVLMVTVQGIKGYPLLQPNTRPTAAAWLEQGMLGETLSDMIDDATFQPVIEAFYRLFGIDIRAQE